jgi:hypothetical protein
VLPPVRQKRHRRNPPLVERGLPIEAAGAKGEGTRIRRVR